ncbi:MAG: tRNA (guanosine(46)-N7)-methyltransferase TrmB [Rhodovibrionaceae bacterium]|nr:tRNA (guanosine(46)-N7)-methyltransferase TrmB [Rhodovibrionaceae bacterium]
MPAGRKPARKRRDEARPAPEEGAPRGLTTGRRQGRPLRPGRRRLLADLLPRVRIEVPEEGVLDPASLFDRPVDALWLEIGFGSGEHLAWQAAQNPGVGMIGAEMFLNGVAAALSEIEARGLDNLRILPDDAQPLLAALPPASLHRVFILFPDPWPKARHHKRRLIQPATLDRLAAAMADDAELRLATDDPGYLVWILRHLQAHRAFTWTARRADDWRRRPADWPETRYEAKARAAGRTPVYLLYRRRPRGKTSEGEGERAGGGPTA